MALYNIVPGLFLLVFGLKLFWLFVAIAGFLFGVQFGDLVLLHQAHWIRFMLALCTGFLGALLAILAQRVAFALAIRPRQIVRGVLPKRLSLRSRCVPSFRFLSTETQIR